MLIALATTDIVNEPIGVGLLALLLVRELFTYLKGRDNTDRRKPISEDIDSALKISIVPLLNKQTDILTELKILSSQSREYDIRSQIALEGLNDDHQKIRFNLHAINDKLHGQRIIQPDHP